MEQAQSKGGAAVAQAAAAAMPNVKVKPKRPADVKVIEEVISSNVKTVIEAQALEGWKLSQMNRAGGMRDFEALWMLIFYR